MKKTMENEYKISRIILAFIVFIIFNTILIIGDSKYWISLPIIFALITFGISFLSSKISRKIISIANKLESKLSKILYYMIALPIIIFLSFCLIYIISIIPIDNTLNAALRQGIIVILLSVFEIFGIVLPYVQTLIVLILKCFVKKHKYIKKN